MAKLHSKLAIATVLICFYLLGTYAEQEGKSELDFFQSCVDRYRTECFGRCEKASPATKDVQLGFSEHPRDSWLYHYDTWSTYLLGLKVMRKKTYTPCQDRCVQSSHVYCTQENWKRGGVKTFPLFGRMPMIRVGIVEEAASAFFSGACTIAFVTFLYRYSKQTHPKHLLVSNISSGKIYPINTTLYPFRHLFQIYYLNGCIVFASATLFHIKDTPFTERLDYYTAFLSILYILWSSIVRVFWTERTLSRVIVGLPIALYSLYHLHYMQYVSFDYGYNMLVLVLVGIADSLLWFGWWFKTRYPHGSKVVGFKFLMALCALFEVFDFAPLGGYVDAHAIWHACMIIIAAWQTQFLVLDAQYFQTKKDV